MMKLKQKTKAHKHLYMQMHRRAYGKDERKKYGTE